MLHRCASESIFRYLAALLVVFGGSCSLLGCSWEPSCSLASVLHRFFIDFCSILGGSGALKSLKKCSGLSFEAQSMISLNLSSRLHGNTIQEVLGESKTHKKSSKIASSMHLKTAMCLASLLGDVFAPFRRSWTPFWPALAPLGVLLAPSSVPKFAQKIAKAPKITENS